MTVRGQIIKTLHTRKPGGGGGTNETILYGGTSTPKDAGTWSVDQSGAGSLDWGISNAGSMSILLEDSVDSDTGDATGMTRCVLTVPLDNTTDPVIECALSVAMGVNDDAFGLVLVGSTGQISFGFFDNNPGNIPNTLMKLHTGTSDDGANQAPSSGHWPSAEVMWLRLSCDSSNSHRTEAYMSTDGVNWVQCGGNEFLNIGTLQSCGIHAFVDGRTTGRAKVYGKMYHFDQS